MFFGNKSLSGLTEFDDLLLTMSKVQIIYRDWEKWTIARRKPKERHQAFSEIL